MILIKQIMLTIVINIVIVRQLFKQIHTFVKLNY